ncbi:hypothetical protein ABES58_07070 [Paenibacillus lautus]
MSKPIVINQGAWIGIAATIMPGVTIGKHSVVSAELLLQKMFLIIQSLVAYLQSSSKQSMNNNN